MKSRALCALVGLACGSAVAAPPGVPQSAAGFIKVDPISLCTVRRVDGQIVRTSEWVPYTGASNRETGDLVFDSAQLDVDTHAPYGGVECDMPDDGNTYRWFFGTGYYAPFAAEDMTFDTSASGGVISEIDPAWFLGISTPIDTDFVLVFFTYNEMIDNIDCGSSSVGIFPDDFSLASDGIAANFGELAAGAGWYYSNIDALNDLGMLLPDGGEGTHEQLQLWYDVIGDVFSICPGPCQFMLYGTSDDGGLPGRPGTNDIQVYLDDGGGIDVPDGAYDPAVECYDFSAGVCPDPLAVMMGFWDKSGPDCTASADHDGDGFITGIDYDLFVADYEFGCLDNTPPCTNSADHDGDGFITGIDFDLYVADFEAGCL